MKQKLRLDQALTRRGLATTRSQAESTIKLGNVRVNGQAVAKSGFMVSDDDEITLVSTEHYVSRAGLKLASVARSLGVDFAGKVVLDVGSSTGGFTDYALQHGAVKVIAVDVGTEQLHPSLRSDARIELHEKRDIREVKLGGDASRVASQNAVAVRHKESSRSAPLPSSEIPGEFPRRSLGSGPVDASTPTSRSQARLEVGAAPRVATRAGVTLSGAPDVVVMDVSFISLREILPHIAMLSDKQTEIIAMLKPQFEAGKHQVNKGVIKNDSVRRQILKDFEAWVKQYYVIRDKKDSDVAGSKGNRERFYLLRKV